MMHLAMAALLALAQNDKTQANSYDDAWEAGWKAHCQAVLSGGTGKTTGLVLQVGDSITHANPYSQWPRSTSVSAGKTSEDDAVCLWALTTVAFPATQTDPTSTNGFYLAVADTSGGRGMTASGGIATDEFISGNGNGGTLMPADTTQSSARTKVADGGGYTGNIHITTLANAYSNAQFAVLMLGTNDFTGSRTVPAFIADLTTIINTLEGMHIAVVLSTIPPRFIPGGPPTVQDVTAYNTAIRSLAQSIGLPLIDYYAEILARRPGTTWENTLISSDGIHPTGAAASADPYSPGGNALTHQTGTNATNDGYLLRSWLTMQKLKEVKSYVIDDAPIPGGGGTAPSSGACGLTGLEAAILLALLAAYRKSGF